MLRAMTLVLALGAAGLSTASARDATTIPVVVAQAPVRAPLDALVSDYEAWNLAQSPISAGQNGDRAALSKLPDVTPAAEAARKAALEGFRTRLEAISPTCP